MNERDRPNNSYIKFADDTGIELVYRNLTAEEVKFIVNDFLVFIQVRTIRKNFRLNVGKTEIVSNDPRIEDIVVEGVRLPNKKMFRL